MEIFQEKPRGTEITEWRARRKKGRKWEEIFKRQRKDDEDDISGVPGIRESTLKEKIKYGKGRFQEAGFGSCTQFLIPN